MPIEKNIAKLQQSSEQVPENLAVKKEKYDDAGYTYTFSPKEKSVIRYNTLRNKRKATELVDVVKIYRLMDEDEGKEFRVHFQNSKVKDFSNNLIKCPVTEIIGVCDDPQTEQVKDQDDNVTDINLVETHNYYYKDWTQSEIEELFKNSRNSKNIACYVGYTRNPKTGSNDFINNKKLIKDQQAFITKSFDELMSLPDNLNKPKSFNKSESKKTLKYGSVKKRMVNTDMPEGIENRIKDNGQLHSKSVEEITKEEEEKYEKEVGEDGEVKETEEKTEKKTSTTNEDKPKLQVGSGSGSGSSGGGTGAGSGSSSSSSKQN